MGSVYEAEQLETGRHVALKCIEAGLLVRGKSSVGRFQREAKAMGSIATDHIVRVLATGTDPGSKAPYMVMDLLEGEDLQHLLDRVGRLEPDTALRIAAQVCLGLQKAHEARVVHRDIKPANLFLARRGAGEIVVKILDFGIAKIKPDPAQGGPTTGLTRTGGVLGSPRYMSPEQARGLQDIDVHTDIWSLGMVLYRALSGKLPLEHIDAFGDLIIAICSQIPRPIQELAPWVRPEAAAVVHGALQLDAGDRFPTAAAMLDAIRPLLPDGWALRDELLVPVSAATRALIAAKLPLVHAADDAHRRLVRIAAQGRSVDGSETTEEEPGSGRGTAALPVLAAPRVTRGAMDAPARPRGRSAPGLHARPNQRTIPATDTAAPALRPVVLSQGSDHVLVQFGTHLLGIWDGAVSLASVRLWQLHLQLLVKANPRRTVYISYERAGFQMPDDAVRKLIADTLRTIDGQLAACVVILPGEGFKAAAVRALVSGIALAARPKSPLGCVKSVAEAQSWVAARVVADVVWPDATTLEATIHEIESRTASKRSYG
jgi:serine/threonine-protein kinase